MNGGEVTYRGYTGTLRYSPEDGLYIGEVLDVKDSLNYHGKTVSEATRYFHDCIDWYLDEAKEADISADVFGPSEKVPLALCTKE